MESKSVKSKGKNNQKPIFERVGFLGYKKGQNLFYISLDNNIVAFAQIEELPLVNNLLLCFEKNNKVVFFVRIKEVKGRYRALIYDNGFNYVGTAYALERLQEQSYVTISKIRQS